MATLYGNRSTPPQPTNRRHNIVAEPEPTTLPPLQSSSIPFNHADPVSLPPISPYSHPQQPPPPPYHLTSQPMTPTNQHEGLHALYQAAHHQAPPQQSLPDAYANSYMADYQTMPIPDDGFGFNLQQMLDPSWSAPNAPAALYSYPPGTQHYPHNHNGY